LNHLNSIIDKSLQICLVAEHDEPDSIRNLKQSIESFRLQSQQWQKHLMLAMDNDTLTEQQQLAINDILITIERKWLRKSGIPGRPWFRSLYAASDEDSGYAAWMLPALRYAVEHHNRELFDEVTTWYIEVFNELSNDISNMENILNNN